MHENPVSLSAITMDYGESKTPVTLSRRAFLRWCTCSGLLLSLWPGSQVQALSFTRLPKVSIPGAQSGLNSPQFQDHLQTGTAPFLVAVLLLNNFRRNLDFANLPSAMKDKFIQAGGTYRDRVEARKVWETIPKSIRAVGPTATEKVLEGKDWSHIVSKSNGGSDLADNGIFEKSSLNRQRGPRNMTPEELEAARQVLNNAKIQTIISQTLSAMLKGAMVGVAITVIYHLLDSGLKVFEGTITPEECYCNIVSAAVVSGVSSVIIMGVITGLVLAFPVLIPIFLYLSIPFAAVGYVVLGYQFYRMGKSWFIALERTGAFEQFAVVLATLEAGMRSAVHTTRIQDITSRFEQWQPATVWQSLKRRTFDNIGNLDFAVDFNALDYFPNLPVILDLTRYTPNLSFGTLLPVLDFDLAEKFPDISFSNRRFRAQVESEMVVAAQDCLKRMAAYSQV